MVIIQYDLGYCQVIGVPPKILTEGLIAQEEIHQPSTCFKTRIKTKEVGPFEGNKAREVLVLDTYSLEKLLKGRTENA